MSAPALIVALYPPAVRERWGDEIGREIAERGARSWPDAIGGAARLWLHPSDWPETAAGQTRRVLAVALFAVTGTDALLLRAAEPATGRWLGLILAGALLAAPRPPSRALRAVAAAAIRTLAAPATAGLALLLLANSGLVDHPAGPARVLLVAAYWAALTFITLRVWALTARIVRMGTAPSRRRLRAALLLVGAGTALAAGQSLLGGALLIAAALLLSAVAALHAGQDLHGR
ncbi:hypothetical protein ABT369_06035 [Dactylosporangium sp. NPDC000244]|uniref:hypothetical protein n=1 Tax=Dactylosporangium sp. NPDC000244 TaxID=3154365 RepID=UPI00332DAED5